MNKNLLIAGIFGFLVSASIAEIYAIYSPSDVLTSTITVLVGFIIYKISFAWSIFDIVNNLSRWIILYELLLTGFRPFEAAILSSIAASSLSYLSINIISKRLKIFS